MPSLAGLLFLFCDHANAHGRLMVPTTRKPTGYENDPVGGYMSDDFVCRNALTTPASTITAGTDLTLRWNFGAAHVGDCAVFLSYEPNQATRSLQKYFKIANLFDCKSQNNQDVTIKLPNWLPAGQAVLRWDWYALHQYPNVEFYSQCADVTVANPGTALSTSQVLAFSYSITEPPIYPQTGNQGVGYRNPFAQTEQFMTGTMCANGYTENTCDLTKLGTTGHVEVSGLNPVEAPTEPPTNPGDQPTMPPTLKPECETYEVVSGDSLGSIATAYTNAGKPVTWQDICDFNKLADCNSLDIGDDLMIPCATCGCTDNTNWGAPSQPPTPCPGSQPATANTSSNGGAVAAAVLLGLFGLPLSFLLGLYLGDSSKFKDRVLFCERFKGDGAEGATGDTMETTGEPGNKVEMERRATVTKVQVSPDGTEKEVGWRI